MDNFPHLNFIEKVNGKARIFGGGSQNPISEENKRNRKGHASTLNQSISKLREEWIEHSELRKFEELGILDNQVVPVYIQLNSDLFADPTFDLLDFGIEIISEEDEGFIIGASLDNLKALEEKIKEFTKKKRGSGKIADFWKIQIGNREEWKPKHILSEALYSKWSSIQDEEVYEVEIGIAFDRPIKKEPDRTKKGGEKRHNKFLAEQIERDEELESRHSHFQEFILTYGELISSFVDLDDSFSCKARISGLGLKDLVHNYQYVFEVNEIDPIQGEQGLSGENSEIEIELIEPGTDAPIIGIIDSGVMEGHKYLSRAIDPSQSKSYLDNEISTADYCSNGGHGTKVAGAVLYPNGITNIPNPYQIPFKLINLRVLDKDNKLKEKYPAKLIEEIISEFTECSIFNHSLASSVPFRKKHMSAWAAVIDSLIHKHSILFVVPTGNISKDIISDFIRNGKNYPNYLDEKLCQIANPSQSFFALCVGSVNHQDLDNSDWISIGGENEIAPYSRTGFGIWNTLKPDVVEYGGGLGITKDGRYAVKELKELSTELIRSTLHGGGLFCRETVGTSFAAPKVTNIVGHLKRLYPNEGANLFRALVVQGARQPGLHFLNPTISSFKRFGFGIPSLQRVTTNNENRITFYNSNYIKAEEGHIYSVNIPESLSNPGNEYDILIEITLAYTAQVRRTRQKLKSYLSTWLDWSTSKLGETYDEFKSYALKEINSQSTSYDDKKRKSLKSFQWVLSTDVSKGKVKDISRNNGTIQKDWTVVKSFDLPRNFSIAVKGHKGWDRNMSEVPYSVAVSFEVLGANVPIYEVIRLENQIESEVSTN